MYFKVNGLAPMYFKVNGPTHSQPRGHDPPRIVNSGQTGLSEHAESIS